MVYISNELKLFVCKKKSQVTRNRDTPRIGGSMIPNSKTFT